MPRGVKGSGRIDDVISVRAFANMMEVSAMTVSKAIKDGKIVEGVLRGDDGKVSGVDWRMAKKSWAKNHTMGQQGLSPVVAALEAEGELGVKLGVTNVNLNDTLDIADSKRLQEHYKAELAKIELEEKQKALVSAIQVKKDLYSFGVEVRVAMQGIPDACVDKVLLNAGDRRKAKREIADAVEFALNKLTEVVERDFG